MYISKDRLLYGLVLVVSVVIIISDLPHLLKLSYLHFIGDYVLTTPKMQRHKTEGIIEGIALHSFVHAIIIFMYFWVLTNNWLLALTLTLCEWWWHLVQDIIKSWINRNYWGNPGTREYWIIFGLDQFLHIYAKHKWLKLMLYWL